MLSFGGRLIALKQHERRSGDANLIERCVNRLKQFSRIAARYEKTARAYLSMLSISMNLALCLGMGWHKKGAGCCSLGIGGFHYARHCHVYWNIVCWTLLGLRFKIFVLVPFMLIAACAVIVMGHELKVVALTVLATAVLQIGYLFGVVIRVWGWRLGGQKIPRQQLSQNRSWL
jgi:hypothetical protein